MRTDILPTDLSAPAKYKAPHLEKLGDLRTYTLGGSLGSGEAFAQKSSRAPDILPGDADERVP